MSIHPRTLVAWLLSVALMAAFAPIPVAEAHGGGHGGGGGGGGFHSGGGGGFHSGGGGGFHSGGGGGFHSGGGYSGFHGGTSMGSFHGGTAFHSGSVGSAWHGGTPYMASRISPNGFHGQSFAGRGGNWNAGRFDHGVWDHGGDFWRHGHGFGNWWGFGIGGLGYGLGWWPGYYGYDDWGPYNGIYGGYAYDVAPYTDDTPYYAVDTGAPVETAAPMEPTIPMEANTEESDFYSQALAAFQEGDYGNATRLASHAAIDNPKNPDVHMLLSLGLFAVGQYRGAAMEAHAVAALGTVPDWPKLAGLYGNNVNPYTDHLRALEKFVRNNPSAPEGRFLLGFQYMIDGHRTVAQDQLLLALKLAPRDRLAAQLLTKEGGTIPADIAKQLESARRQAPNPGIGSGVTK